MRKIDSIESLFSLWSSLSELAEAIQAKPDTVRKWRKHQRIPQDSWLAVIKAARRRGVRLTADDLLALSAPMGRRGRPAHRRSRSRTARREAVT